MKEDACDNDGASETEGVQGGREGGRGGAGAPFIGNGGEWSEHGRHRA